MFGADHAVDGLATLYGRVHERQTIRKGATLEQFTVRCHWVAPAQV
jgi:hypothetical protein